MTEYYHGQTPRSRFRRFLSATGTGIFVFTLFVIFIISVVWFRRPKDRVDERIDSIAQIMKPDPISQAVLNGAIDTESKTAVLHLTTSTTQIGEGVRGQKDEAFFLQLKATLPEIDREVFFYEAWLVRPIPYNYLSVGELTTNELGEFVTEWTGKKEIDYTRYADLVITRQEYGGSEDPGIHIVEGTFNK